MPKYDAFGREIGEDTLEGLGGSPEAPESAWEERTERDEATWQAAERVEVARLETAAAAQDVQAERTEDARQAAAGASRWTAPAGPTVTVRRSGSAKGCLTVIVVALLIGGAAIAGVVSLVSSIDIDTGGIEEAIKPPNLAGPQPKGLAEGSLMRRADVAAALRQLRSDETVKLTNLRLAPERIDATLLTREGRLRHMQMQAGGKLERLGTDSGAGFDTVPTIPFAKLDPGAPQRLARRGAREHGVPISELQYAVPTYSRSDGRLTWVVYFTRGRYVLGDAKGRFQRKLP